MALDRNDYNDPAQPAFGKATVSIDTPNIADISVVEEFPGSPENYRPLPYGTPHPKNPETGLDLRLVWQGPVKAANNQVRIKRVYSTEPLSQNWYNFAIKYSGDETAAPIYVRTYLTLRDDYAPAATRQPLTGITQLRITSGGSGYTSDPTISFTGGGGSGASALPIRDVQSGEIVGLRIVSEGSGYTSPPTVSITGGAGTGATAVAAIQPTDAVLVKEETQRLENDNPQKASLFIRVHRVYETLPGPWLDSSRFDDDGALITIASRRVLSGSSSLGETFDPGTSTLYKTTEKADESSVVALEVVESRAIPGPWNTTTRQGYDGLTVTVQSRKQLLADITSGESVGSGIWTKRFAKPVDGSSLIALEVIETRAVPGLGVPKTEVDEAGNITTVTRTLVVKSTLATTTVVSGGTWTRTYEEPVEDSNLVAWKVVAVRPAPNTMPEFTIEIPDLVPEQFRADIPIETTKTRVTGTASMPTLGTGDIRRTERQVDQQSYELTITTRGNLSLPVTITGLKETNDKKQVVTVSLTLEADTTTPTAPTATTDVEFKKLGNGLAVEIIRTVTAVFADDSYTKSILNLIPERLRAVVPMVETSVDSAGTPSTNPTLLTGELSRTESRVNSFTKRIKLTKLGVVSVPVSVTDIETNDQKQVVAVVHTLNTSGSSTTVPTALIDVTLQDLGNGYEVETTRTIAEIFDADTYSVSIPNVIPEEFRALIQLRTEIHLVAGTAGPPTLGAGEFERSERQINEFVKQVQFNVLADIGSLPISLTGIKKTNERKQVVDVSMTLEVDSTTPSTPNSTTAVEFRKLGNGLAIETLTAVGVFNPKNRKVGSPTIIPERFRAEDALHTSEDVVVGTVPDTLSLGLGEVEREETQLTAFTKLVRSTILDIGSLPTLDGQEYDDSLDVAIPYTEEIAAAGTAIGDSRTQISPLGAGLELVKVLDLSAVEAALDGYDVEFPGSASVALPAVLTSVDTVVETMVGNGDDGLDTYVNASWVGHGSWSVRYDAEVTSSAAIMPDVIERIQQPWGHNKDTTHHLFFSKTPAAAIAGLGDAWPDFNPESVTIVVTSRKVSLRVKATVSGSDGGSDDSGEFSEHSATGASREVTISTKTIRIPPTIHSNIGISLSGTTTQDVTAHAKSHIGRLTAERTETDTISASISPSTTGGTSGAQSIPSGNYVFNTDVAPYRYGYFRCHVEVVHL